METKPGNFQGDPKSFLDSQCRSLCLKGFTSGTNIYYMETRAIQQRDIVFQHSRNNLKGNVSPPFCLIGRVLRNVQIDMATLTLINPAYSSLAKLNLVPKSPLNEHEKSNFNSQNKQPFVESILPRMSSCDKQNNTASNVGSCRGKLVVEGLSKQAFSYYSESRIKGSINH